MARRVPRQPVIALLAGLLLAAAPSPVLIRYSFDDELTATGPDTFAVFRNAKGSVEVSTAFHGSGYRSVEIRDVAGDHDFPELQGFFPERRTGRMALRFSLLTTDPREELNAALAGPGGFTLGKDGISFWLATRDGFLIHVSDSIPKRLLRLAPFTWYRVAVDYDVDRGRYDLTIVEEGSTEPAVSLRDQPNAASQPGSAVHLFSFIGDNGDDRSNVTYYVDDVVVASGRGAAPPEFVAPGRKAFFVDSFAEQRNLFRKLRAPGSRISCLPVFSLAEVGIERADVDEIEKTGQVERLGELLDPAARPAAGKAGPYPPKLRPVALWKEGCTALARGEAGAALARFDEASRLASTAEAFDLSRLLAFIALQRWPEADDLLGRLHPGWQRDPRYAVASALAAVQRGNLEEARALLDPGAARELGEAPSAPLIAEAFFHLALLEGRSSEARDYALRMAERLTAAAIPAGDWIERAGDAAFAQRDLAEARQLYEKALAAGGSSTPLFLKLADVHFLAGDLAAEKSLREKIYGSLDPK